MLFYYGTFRDVRRALGSLDKALISKKMDGKLQVQLGHFLSGDII